MLKQTKPIPRVQDGLILIEGLIAILVFSLALLGLSALQATSIRESMHANYRTEASYLANAIISQMMTDKNNVGAYGKEGTAAAKLAWVDQVEAALPNGSGKVEIDATDATLATVTITWRKPEEDADKPHRYSTVARIVF